MSYILSTIEKKVILALAKLGKPANTLEVAKKAGIRRDQVLATIESLKVKSLIDAKEVTKAFYELTDEGKLYVEKRVPEVRLIMELSEIGKISTKELPKIVKGLTKQELNIALNWARKKGLVTFEKEGKHTFVSTTEKGEVAVKEKLPIERLLSLIHQYKQVANERIPKELSEALREAINRKLVKVLEEKDWVISLTEKGLTISKHPEIQKETVSRLTRDLIVSGKWESVEFKPYNLQALPPLKYPGKKHPYTVFLEEMRKILISMGFVEAKGPFVESEFWNFDVLFQPQDHVAREIHDSFIVKQPKDANLQISEFVEKIKATHENGWVTGSTGWGYTWDFQIARRLILRSQTTAVSARTLFKGVPIPFKMFSIDKVFRPDVIDKTHSIEFMQCEGIVVGEHLTLKHLLGYLKQFAIELGFEKIKFKPSYFPFTEPSVEAFLYHPKLGWFEALGAGLFRPEVLIPLNIDYPRVQVLAWGIGIDRLAMLKLGIDDIRYLHSQDLQWLREKELWW
ncbi:MAG: phenylalanine--tRNA ligase subunit alpha [Candidatus Asgardarchaeia archaeon]